MREGGVLFLVKSILTTFNTAELERSIFVAVSSTEPELCIHKHKDVDQDRVFYSQSSRFLKYTNVGV